MTSTPQTTVFLVDDDPAIVRLLTPVVARLGLRIQSYESGGQFLADYTPSGPACLVVDLKLPDMDGLEVQRRAAALGGALSTIVITAHSSVRAAVSAIRGGAVEFLEKPFQFQAFTDALLRGAAEAQKRWEENARRQESRGRLESLDAGQRRVFDLVVAGETNAAIARQLGLSVRGVEHRRAKLMEKLATRTRADLLRLAIEAGILRDVCPRIREAD